MKIRLLDDTLCAMNLKSLLLCAAALLACSACDRYQTFRRGPKPELGKHLTVGPKDTADLTDREYLMRKATLGTRSERLEALDVIERANDPELFVFLMDRLKKEDDRFLQIRIMHALAASGDVRAIPPLRHYARWDTTRVGVEATAALYELGDDSFMPRLIMKLRPDEDNPEMPGIAHRALKKMTGVDLPPTTRAWMNYYRVHRLAPYESRAWFWPFRAPLPPTVEGTTKVVPHPKGRPPLPTEDLKIRRTQVTWSEFWRPDEP
jgi:hypothetical protein